MTTQREAVATTETIEVEVAFALPRTQALVAVRLARGARIADAIAASGLVARFPGLDAAHCRVGIFGRPCERDTPLQDGDRVEIYRELPADPKEIRRRRALEGKRPHKTS